MNHSPMFRILAILLCLTMLFTCTAFSESTSASLESLMSDEQISEPIPVPEALPEPVEFQLEAVESPSAQHIPMAASPEVQPMEAGVITELVLTSNGAITMNVGDQLQIRLDGTEATSWKSNKAKIASVSETGLVAAQAKGKAKITVATAAKKKYKLTVNVVDPYEPASVGIAQGGQITMNVGEILVLTPVLTPETARTTYTWKSSKGKVASVGADGTVSALAEGKTKITVTTANKKKVTTVVNIVDPYKPASVGIAQGGEITMVVGDNLVLTPVLSPDSARTTYTWKSSKKKVAVVGENGSVTATAPGTTKITVTTANKKKATTVVHVVAATSSGNTSIPAVQYTSVNYNDILQNPNGYNGAVYQFTGKVYQVCEEKKQKGGTALIELLVSTGSGGSGNAIYLSYTRQKNDHCFVKGEFANITAVCKGIYSYSTTSDSIATVPLFEGYSVALASSPTPSETGQQLTGEISSILGMDFNQVRELIPDKFRYFQSSTYTNDYILVETNSNGIIRSIALLTDATSGIGKYTIFGIYPGIQRSKAIGILANYGWLPRNNSATTNYYDNASKPDQSLYLTYLSGKIDLILYANR